MMDVLLMIRKAWVFSKVKFLVYNIQIYSYPQIYFALMPANCLRSLQKFSASFLFFEYIIALVLFLWYIEILLCLKNNILIE